MREPLELSYQMTPQLQLQAAYGWTVNGAVGGVTWVRVFWIVLWFVLVFAMLGILQGGAVRFYGLIAVMAIGGFMVVNGISCVFMNQRILQLYGKIVQGTGNVTFRLREDALSISDEASSTRLERAAIDDVIALKGATGLRLGAQTKPIPDSALPDDLTPDAMVPAKPRKSRSPEWAWWYAWVRRQYW